MSVSWKIVYIFVVAWVVGTQLNRLSPVDVHALASITVYGKITRHYAILYYYI